jgi:hypothetical protein
VCARRSARARTGLDLGCSSCAKPPSAASIASGRALLPRAPEDYAMPQRASASEGIADSVVLGDRLS